MRPKSAADEYRIVCEADAIWPEFMALQPSKLLNRICDNFRRCRICIGGLANNPDRSVLNDWTCCPRQMPFVVKPCTRSQMMNVRFVDQRNQNIGIEQCAHQSDSSRSRFTSSSVARPAFSPIGKSGTPLRYRNGCSAMRMLRRAMSDMTAPTGRRSRRAMSLATLKTSSSIVRVVRISVTSSIKHRMSTQAGKSGRVSAGRPWRS